MKSIVSRQMGNTNKVPYSELATDADELSSEVTSLSLIMRVKFQKV